MSKFATSLGDFNDVDDENWNINQMPDYEVIAEFNKMLENMNLNGVQKKPLENLPMSEKRKMLSLDNKNKARERFKSWLDQISDPEKDINSKYLE